MRVHLRIHGIVSDAEFQRASFYGKQLALANEGVTAEIIPFLSVEWDQHFEQEARTMGADAIAFYSDHGDSPVLIYTTKQFIGGAPALEAYISKKFPGFDPPQPSQSFAALGRTAFVETLKKTEHSYYYIEFGDLGRVIFELFDDICPNTTAKFAALCENGYVGSTVTRVAKDGWIQCGDVTDAPVFEDENFIVKHDVPFLLGMANKGRHTNASQFYITLKPLPVFDTQFVAFGRMVEGVKLVQAVNSRETFYSQKPTDPIEITAAGKLDLATLAL